MPLEIDFNNRSVQIGLGVTAAGTALAAILAKSGALSSLKTGGGISHDGGSIKSCKDAGVMPSLFSSTYQRISASNAVVEEEPVLALEVNTEPVEVLGISKTGLLGNLTFIAKAVFLLPFVVVGSILKGVILGVLSLFQSKNTLP